MSLRPRPRTGRRRSERTATSPSIDLHPIPGARRRWSAQPSSTGAAAMIDNGTVLFRDGKVVAVGDASLATDGYDRIDGSGKFVTPGVIDIHSHLGDYPTPSVQAHSDGNEATSPMTPEVWAEHSVWPQDPGFHPCAGQWRRHQPADPAGFGQSHRRPLGHAEERFRADRAGHEIPRRALRHEDGLRRESQACLRRQGPHAFDPHGQFRGQPADVARCAGL